MTDLKFTDKDLEFLKKSQFYKETDWPKRLLARLAAAEAYLNSIMPTNIYQRKLLEEWEKVSGK